MNMYITIGIIAEVCILTDNNRKSRPYIELDQDMLIYIDADVS